MRTFVIILIAMAIIGGLVGGEVMDMPFSIMGAVVGFIGSGAIMLGLGAYFTAQDQKNDDLPGDVRDVFDRMITGKENPTKAEILEAKRRFHGVPSKPKMPNFKSKNKNSPLAIILNSLDKLKSEYSNNDVYAANAVQDTFEAAKRSIKLDKNELHEYLNVDKRDPAEIALTSLWNVSRDTVASGGVHFYRAALSDRGRGYLYVFNKTVDILLEKGFIDEAEAKGNKQVIQQDIKNAG
jgi:hypothetical protein